MDITPETFDPGVFTQAVEDGDLQTFLDLLSDVEGAEEGPGERDSLLVLNDSVFGEGMPLLHFLCSKKDINEQFIKALLHLGINVNLFCENRGRPIHVACSENCPENLKVLLDYGAKILEAGEQAWQENSPFYVSSLCGHVNIIRILLSYQPKLIREQDVRSCLLYAACAGGNKDIVGMWYCPGMDINQPKPYIQSLDNSGDNTPIFAACAGGHYEVVKHLVDMGARLTHRVCTDFPDITGRILLQYVQQVTPEDISDRDVIETQHTADYSKIQLTTLHGNWLRAYTETLVTLNISDNSIEELPEQVPWSFPNLQRFNASHNSLLRLRCGAEPPVCHRLSWIQLSHNKLETLCRELFQIRGLEELYLSYNQLQYLIREHQVIYSQPPNNEDVSSHIGPGSKDWSCDKLTRLDVSNNQLKMLPSAIKQCTGLVTLDASHNCMTAFCGGWDCNLANLNLSHNDLERFPEDVEMFWCGSLHYLNLDNNQLEVLADSIVKLCALTDLIVSNNHLTMLPKAEIWDCPQLYLLNLHGNLLGQPPGLSQATTATGFRQKLMRNTSVNASRIVLPKFLAYCLHDLNLKDNHLDGVPEGICHLSTLTILNLSKNPAIKSLPNEMGKLTSLTALHLTETSVKQTSGQAEDSCQRTKDTIMGLQHELRKSKPYNKIKLVILGKKDKGKTTLSGLLHGNKIALFHGDGIHRCEMKLPGSGNQLFKRPNSEITFSVWDMACSDQYIPSQQCFFTRNSLYILVWDIWSLKNELDKLGHWLYSIEARTPNSRVILVTTFLDKVHLTNAERDEKVSDILKLVIDRYGPRSSSSHLCSHLDLNNIVPVSCTTKEGIPLLKQKLFEIASNMYDPMKGLGNGRLLTRKVPLSYLSVEKAVEQKLAIKVSKGDPPFIEEEEFQALIRSIPNNDITTEDDINAVTQFLVETGSLLHYHDQLRGLNTMYILDPSWLCDLLAKVLIDDDDCGLDGQIGRDGKIHVADIITRYRNDDRFPDEYIGQYLQLLERFEIALSVDNGKKLFIPGRLSQSPALQFHSQEFSGTNVYRLYQMAFIPTGFWSRLLSRIMARLQLLEQPNWVFQSSISGGNPSMTRTVCQSRLQHTVVGRQFSGHLGGLHIKKKDMIYWQDGMCTRHTTGYFKLETIRLPQGREKPSKMGILVTVHSTEDEFSIMGTIVDEIDDLLTDHYPGLLEWDESGEPRVQRYALCPRCYDISSSSLPSALDHFTVEHCSRVVLTEDTISCKTGALIPLEQLVPELFIKEIPQEYHMDQTRLKVQQDTILGRGVSGSVYKGKYGNVDVAVKFYHGMPTALPSSGPDSMDSGQDSWKRAPKNPSPYTSSSDYQDEANPYGNYKDLSQGKANLDNDEENSLKAWRSFMEMRQEVAVTSKLHHPCVISFIGICVKPKLLMCLEFAALGNVRNVLDKAKVNRKPFNKHRDRDKRFKMILSKDLTFKMVFQIASGLQYLHKHGIIYRDLKSDNILATTLDLAAPVNVKLSDYGISKFYSTGGTLGLVGTPGYQAPEIMDAQFYDEKVDIFSFAMVIYEVVSGERPYGELSNIGQITMAIKQEGNRPSLKNYNFDTRFPQLEELMETCWKDKGTDRPSALDIVAGSLHHVHFLCKHKQFNTRHAEIDLLAPVTDGEKNLVWLWEGTDTDRAYTIVDLISCTYHDKKPLAGPTVTCMCKVDQEVWLGTDVGSDEGMIEVWKQLTSGQLHCQATFSCDGIPTNILYIKGRSKTEKKLFVTLHNGKLRTYTKTLPSNRKSLRTEVSGSGWTCERLSQQLSQFEACCAVHVVSSKGEELWVGCGPDIVVYSVSISLVENRIHVAKMVHACIPEYDESLSVQTLVQGDGQVWCLMRDTACVVELDTDMGIATHIYDCDLQYPHKMNTVKEISMDIVRKIEDGNAKESGIDDGDGDDSAMKRETSAPKLPPRRPISVIEPPPRPPRQRLDSVPSLPVKVTPPDRKDSGSTLPPNSKRYSISNVVINSIGVVRDTIWVSRNRGDIVFICTSNYKSFKKGEVIAVLNCKDEFCQDKGKVKTVPNTQTGHCVVESLLCVNDVVVTVVRDDLTCSHLVVWEAYSCEQIDNIRRYWEVRRAESKGKAKVVFKRQKNVPQIPSNISKDNS
ncbi:leucine-rich repeat serine/threonine-protein kinase 1-like isoform X2 [Mizuhopecten yessoensis]|uniref:leucine-rich repeat serine/threonine-protein kinase 1-like isoform X2 n=1 Tax=Mizuhopecten yessoensis TaxID=6573 RepID=UPI000B45D05C|nr:leucine-rich repeat serine/threonine-protein kinase 1-like isoform X2 [Mizuhopecten yessoensis]